MAVNMNIPKINTPTPSNRPELSKRISYILIMRSLSGLSKIDSATYSYVTRYVIDFDPTDLGS